MHDFISKVIARKGVAPSEREVARHFRISASTAHEHLDTLKKRGYLEKEPGRPRAMRVVEPPSTLVRIPLLGTIAAGQPLTLFEMPREILSVPKSKIPFPSSSEIYALRVVGNSMIDENINDGDVIIVKHQATAENGQKVVALIDNNEATLKKFYKERGYIRLQPANKKMEPIIVRKDRDFMIRGIVLDVIKGDIVFQDEPIAFKKSEDCFVNKTFNNYKPKIQKGNLEFYLGDCLDILPTLEQKYRIIYLDPPFNSNREYTYSATGESFGFLDKWGAGEYEQWLDRMIAACKSKLTRDGTLFFHISAELSFIPQLILKKHFNKVEPIFWKKAHGKNTVKNKLGSVVDIVFKASNNGAIFNLVYVPLDAYYFENSYKNKDDVGYYALGSIKHDKTRRGHMYRYERGGIIYEAPYGWKISRTRLDELLKQNRIHFSRPKSGTNRGMLYKKLYKHETKGKPLSNLWDDIAYITRTTKDERLYPTQKPFALLKRIIEIASKPNDWVLDPVAGSGTTGAAALALGRNTTLIDINQEAGKIIKRRLENETIL